MKQSVTSGRPPQGGRGLKYYLLAALAVGVNVALRKEGVG